VCSQRDKFEGAVLVTLYAGIKDSFASAGMSLISSYLDLFTGVLFLWYGGLLAMNNKVRVPCTGVAAASTH
jgi:hypothetical protein